MEISDRCVAQFHYTLTDEAGEVLDSSDGREPMAYLHGAGQIVPGLEKAMAGRAAGDEFNVEVAPPEGYGEHDEALVQTVPRSMFQGVDDIEAGMRFRAESDQGPVVVTVTEAGDEEVTVDGNHALAGKTLNFSISVTDVREASEDELEHGHAHGPGGEEHSDGEEQ